MKILSNEISWDSKTAFDLTPLCDSSILKVGENTFAFCAQDEELPHLVIESEIFSLLMRRLEGRIVHYNVFRPRCLCCDGEGEIVIRMTEADGTIFHFGEDDQVEICMSIENLHKSYLKKVKGTLYH